MNRITSWLAVPMMSLMCFFGMLYIVSGIARGGIWFDLNASLSEIGLAGVLGALMAAWLYSEIERRR